MAEAACRANNLVGSAGASEALLFCLRSRVGAGRGAWRSTRGSGALKTHRVDESGTRQAEVSGSNIRRLSRWCLGGCGTGGTGFLGAECRGHSPATGFRRGVRTQEPHCGRRREPALGGWALSRQWRLVMGGVEINLGGGGHGVGADQTRVETAHPGGSLCTDFPGSGTGDGGHISEADRVRLW